MTDSPGPEYKGGVAESGDPLPPERLRSLRFRMLALLWCLVTPGAGYLIWRDQAWLQAEGFAERLRAVRLEQWIGASLIVLHVRFILGAARTKPTTPAGK